MKKKLCIVVAVVLIVIGGFLVYSSIIGFTGEHNNKIRIIENKMLSEGFKIVDVSSVDCSIAIRLLDLNELLSKSSDKIVYKMSDVDWEYGYFYVFSDDFNIGFYYFIPIELHVLAITVIAYLLVIIAGVKLFFEVFKMD